VYSTRYEPYGNARHTASNGGYTAQPLGYAGAPLDPESGLLYLNARYYAPRNARFLQRDTVFGSDADPASLNRYAYARNNPMVFVDPDGHSPSAADEDLPPGLWMRIIAGTLGVGAVAQAMADRVATIPTHFIRFSQRGISYTWPRFDRFGRPSTHPWGGMNIDYFANILRAGEESNLPAQWQRMLFSPIRVVEYPGYMWTVDNRRLEIFRRAGRDIPFQLTDLDDLGVTWLRNFDHFGVGVDELVQTGLSVIVRMVR
jgi:RHS repeat-associated protein